MPSTYAWASASACLPRSPSVARMRSIWAWSRPRCTAPGGQNSCSRPWLASGAAGEGGQLAASDVAEQVHQPQPVLGGGVAGAELGAVAGGAL